GLAFVRGALAAGPSEGGQGAWWVDGTGLLGGVLAYDHGTLRGGAPSAPPKSRARAARPLASVPQQVDSRRTIILAPYFADQEPAAVDAALRAAQCPLYDVETYTGADAGAERFENLDRYGMVFVASHGESFFQSIGDAYRPEWGWSS